MWPFQRRILPKRGLDTLANHAYKSGEYSPLDNFLNDYWWNVVVEWVPLNIAPNTITLIGTLLMISTLALSAVGIRTHKLHHTVETEVLPPWVHWCIAAFLFIYQTLDAIDGKQARRTKNSSPLGQLFDHGCDAVVTTVCLYQLILALGLGHTWQAASLYVAALTLFFLGQWEESGTHILRTNINGLGVSEAQCLMMLAHIAAAVLPWEVFHKQLTVRIDFGISEIVHISHPLNVFIAAVCLIGVLYAASGYLWTMFAKAVGVRAGISLFPTALLAASMLAEFLLPGCDSRLSGTHPRLVFALYAVSQTFLTTKMIVFSMAHEDFGWFHRTAFIFPAVVAVDVLGFHKFAPLILYSALVVALMSYLSFVHSTVYEIASRLGIYTFKVNPSQTSARTLPITTVASTTAGGTADAVDIPKRILASGRKPANGQSRRSSSKDVKPSRSRSKSRTR